MHVAILTHYFPPEVNAPAQRAFHHARDWVNAGHAVTVVTAAPSHPYGQVYDGYSNRYSEEFVEGIRVLRLATILGPNAGTMRRAVNYASYMVSAALAAKKIEQADIVISTSPHFFCGLAGYPLSRSLKTPWVLEIRDIWPESIVAVGAAHHSPIISALEATAAWAYRTCDKIVSVSPGFSAHFEEHGIRSDKVVIIPNGIDISSLAATTSFEEVPELEPIRGRFIGAYIGTFGMAHGLSTILDAAELLRDDARIGLLLVGSGVQRDFLFEQVAVRRLRNVVILDQQPRPRVAKLWALASASIVHLMDKPVFETVIPTKLLEGMAMSKPILLGVRGQARTILAAAGAGLSFDPESASGLALALQRLVNDKEQAADFGRNGHAFVCREFDRSLMSHRYLETLQAIVGGPRADSPS